MSWYDLLMAAVYLLGLFVFAGLLFADERISRGMRRSFLFTLLCVLMALCWPLFFVLMLIRLSLGRRG